jgi:hypothetical protein
MIAEAAHFRAAGRGFAPGGELDFAVARRPRELACRDAGAVRLDLAMRLAVGGVVTVAAVEGAQDRRRAGSAVGHILDLPAEFGLFAAKLVAPDPRSAGILTPDRRVGLRKGPAVLPGGLDLALPEFHDYGFRVMKQAGPRFNSPDMSQHKR